MPPEIAAVLGLITGVTLTILDYHYMSTAFKYGQRILKAARGNVTFAEAHVQDVEQRLKDVFAGIKRFI